MAGKDDVRVRIGGDAAALKSAFGEATGLTNRFAQGAAAALKPISGVFGGLVGNLFSLRGAIATLAGTGGLGLLVKSAIETADGIAKMADRTGLGIEALQELRYAASLSGMDADRFGRAMERLNVAIAESARGTGEAQETWVQAGIALRDNEGRLKSTERLFMELADAVAATEDATRRADIVNKIFGQRLGGQLLPLFKGGAAGIAELRAEARQLGVVLDSVMVREAERAGDQLERVGTILKTNLVRAVLALTPQIIALSNAFIQHLQPAVEWLIRHLPASAVNADELRRRIGELRAEFKALAGVELGDFLRVGEQAGAAAAFAGYTEDQIAAISRLLGEYNALGQALVTRERQEALVNAALGDGTAATETQAGAVRDLFEALQFELDQLGRTTAEQQLYARAKAAGVAVTDELRATLLPTIEMLELEKAALEADAKATAERTKALEDMKTRAARIFEDTRTPLERLNAQLAELNDLRDAGALGWETYARAVAKAQDAFDAANEKLEPLDKTAHDLGLTFESAFENAVVKGEKLRDVLQGLLDDLVRIATRILVTEPLGNFLSGVFSSFDLGSLFNTGGGFAGATAAVHGAGGFPSAKGNAFRGSILDGPIVPNAKGGVLTSPIAFPLAGGGTGTAAEAGAEGILPLARDGQGRLGVRAAGGGAGVQINIYDQRSGGAAIETRESRGPDGMRQVEIFVREAVRGGIQRGEFDQQLGTAFGLRRGGGIGR